MYIVISGVHGIGKTTIAREIARALSARFLTESIDEALPPPPLGKTDHALGAQLWMSRQMILKERQMTDPNGVYVADRGWADVHAYSRVVLPRDEQDLFFSIADVLPKRTPDIHLIVHAPIAIVLERIAARSRSTSAAWNESDRAYLVQLDQEFRAFYNAFHDLRPIHLVDASGTIAENVDRALQVIRSHNVPARTAVS